MYTYIYIWVTCIMCLTHIQRTRSIDIIESKIVDRNACRKHGANMPQTPVANTCCNTAKTTRNTRYTKKGERRKWKGGRGERREENGGWQEERRRERKCVCAYVCVCVRERERERET